LLFASQIFAQDNSEKVVEVAYEACECIGKIDMDLSYKKKSKEIEECIKSANMSHQLLNSLSVANKKMSDTIPSTASNKNTVDSVKTAPKEINITINAALDYQEIEDYLMDTCGDLKTIYFSNNKESSRKSVSNKEEALEYYNLGIIAYDDQDYEKAIEHYKKALEIDKKFAFAWDNLGMSYRRLGQNEKAIEAYKESLKLDKKGKTPLMNIGVAYELLGKYDDAITYYEKYRKTFKKDPEGYYGLGRMHFAKKDYEPAVDNMIKAYQLYAKINSPYIKDAESNLGIMYRAMKAENKLDLFRKVAKENNLDIGDN